MGLHQTGRFAQKGQDFPAPFDFRDRPVAFAPATVDCQKPEIAVSAEIVELASPV